LPAYDVSVKFWQRAAACGSVARVSGKKRALFLDFGGTLVLTRDGRTVVDADGNPVLMPNVPETLARTRPGFDACFIVSNQARIAQGEITEAEVRRRFAWLNERLGRPLSDWRLCPHEDADGCACRKPQPGMFLDLAATHGIDLSASTHVGNSWKDQEAAAAAGVPTFIWARDFFGW
jgi:D-glycero-D-manno-heptose 1,7-bisphosphate phosphatase